MQSLINSSNQLFSVWRLIRQTGALPKVDHRHFNTPSKLDARFDGIGQTARQIGGGRGQWHIG
jgi:hypothetical protein